MESKRKPKGYWTPERIDRAFDELKEELGRNPRAEEFRNGVIVQAITKGRYLPQIRTWNKYLEHRGLKIFQLKNNWTPEKVDEAFDEMRKELCRDPTSIEFKMKNGGALDSIINERYSPKIKSWNQYLEHRGLETHGWTPEKVDEVFDNLGEKLGKNPKYEEFKRENGGALDYITKGRYSPQIRTWNEYLQHRGLETHGWTPEKVDEVFDKLKDKLGRAPKQAEFRDNCMGAFGYISHGRYAPEITKWSEYVAYRQNGNKVVKQRSEKEQIESLLEGFVNGK